MSDLISREAVIERIKRMADGYSYLEVPTDYLIQELKKIEEAPSIDAVPVVRCKDCIHSTSQVSDDEDTYFCNAHYHGVHSLEFCSRGERKES